MTRRCRCAERRAALRQAGSALVVGNHAFVARQVGFVASSAIADAASVLSFRQQLAQRSGARR